MELIYLKDFEGDLKHAEVSYRDYIPFEEATIVRLDMRSGGRFVRDLNKPWDDTYTVAMQSTAKALLEQVQGTLVAYTGSDEITLVLAKSPNEDRNYAPFFNGRMDKILSLTASIASNEFNKAIHKEVIDCRAEMKWLSKMFTAQFDSRVFSLEGNPVRMGLVAVHSRMEDVAKNSVQMLACHHFSHNQLNKKNTNTQKEMLLDKGVDWETEVSTANKYGTIYYRTEKLKEGYNPKTKETVVVKRSLVQEATDEEVKEFFLAKTLQALVETGICKKIHTF